MSGYYGPEPCGCFEDYLCPDHREPEDPWELRRVLDDSNEMQWTEPGLPFHPFVKEDGTEQ